MIKKIKLRNLTKEQWDKYLSKICIIEIGCNTCPLSGACCEHSTDKYAWINNKDIFNDKFLDQEIEMKFPDILNKDGKEYLSNLIKPFRDKILYISKILSGDNNFISINFGNKHRYIFPIEEEDRYKYCGMKYYQQYTLEELGL